MEGLEDLTLLQRHASNPPPYRSTPDSLQTLHTFLLAAFSNELTVPLMDDCDV